MHSPVRALLAALAALPLAAACGMSHKDPALRLATEACDDSRLSDLDFDSPQGRQAARAEALPVLQDHADKAAQAARLDPTWQNLAEAKDRIAEGTSVRIELGDVKEAFPDASGAFEVLNARLEKLDYEGATDTIRAGCRKTKTS
jgi:hypothetical protein